MAGTGLLKSAKGATKGKMGKGAAIGLGINAAFGISDYNTQRKEGSSRLGAAMSAASTFAMGEVLGMGMIPFTLAPMIPGAVVSSVEGIGKMQRQMNKDARRLPFNNAKFNDYQQAFTMRQAGMQLAQNSQYNLQQTLMGNEASYLK